MDLDGTLLATDVLWESLLSLLRERPGALLMLPLWLVKGRAHLKSQIARRVRLDPAILPYREPLLEFLKREKEAGREIVLATASDVTAASAVSRHLGLFSECLGSDGEINLSGARKCSLLEERFGDRGFDYAGNAFVDVPLWRRANAAIVVTSSGRLLGTVQRVAHVGRVFHVESRRLEAALAALRLPHWLKNLLVFVPLWAGPQPPDGALVLQALWAALALALCASGTYVLDDLFHLDVDRRHPRRKLRSYAAGRLSIVSGLAAAPILILASFALGLATLPASFAVVLAAYVFLASSYSIRLEELPVVDVLVLAGLYTLRLIAGAVATGTVLSPWLAALSMFLFLSLAFARRYAETGESPPGGEIASRSAYGPGDRGWLRTMGIASGSISVLVLALDLSRHHVARPYGHPELLWLTCPMLLYWVLRVWLRAERGGMTGDPIVAMMKDPVTWGLAAVLVALVIVAGA